MEKDVPKGTENQGWSIAREALLAGGMIGLLILGLWFHTGTLPPLVVVESDSMIHEVDGEIGSIDAGDLILVHNLEIEHVVTYAEATQPGNQHFADEMHGMGGDVIIFQKNGLESTPIIHRAILRAIPHDTISPLNRDTGECPDDASWDPESVDIDGEVGTCVLTWDVPGTTLEDVETISWIFDGNNTGFYDCQRNSVYNHGGVISDYLQIVDWDPKHSGIITLGDNNHCSVDQGSDVTPGAAGLPTQDENGRFTYGIDAVRGEWLVGIAGGEIPWLGTVKLALSSGGPGTDYVPSSAWVGLISSIVILLASPFILEPIIGIILASSPEIKEALREEKTSLIAESLLEQE
jgi:signal peptidase I